MCEKQKCNAEKMQFPKQEQQKKVSLPILKFYEIFGMQYFKNLATIKETTYVNLSSSCTYVCKKKKLSPLKIWIFPPNFEFPAP
jgi:hypothetical protein